MALSEDTLSKCSEHMSAYKSACEDHPELKAFDSSLQHKSIKMIDSLSPDPKTGLLSQHAVHMEISKNLLEVSQGVANFILEGENDVWENKALRSLVQAYFDNTIKTLEIFDNVMDYVEKAEMGQLYIQEAVAQFDKESAEKDLGGKKKRYEKTLKNLNKFKAMGDTFDGGELMIQFDLIKKQQESLLQDVSEAKTKLHEEYDNLKAGSMISNVVFGAAFFGTLIVSVGLLITGVGIPFAIAGFLSLPVMAVGWSVTHFLLEKRMDELKKLEETLTKVQGVSSLVGIGIETNKEAMKSVSEIAHQLEKKIASIMKYVDDVIENEGDEVDMKLALHLIREKVMKLTEKIKEVGETVASHSKLILEARFHVLEKINGSGKYHRG
ncbi:hypothetical protein CARUB_v10019413mg [Capsella rubella]|uniref:Uncharacterized protein n=1 Tax=Capsella rubella TaxID=81985 RepID=R0FLJ9_9BRAS|nr:UPF0496 protein At3g28270 [Capsella rubella]EOA23342.1 hypothetical protein CARUB_v10019413mg [Capsella rubella]